MLGVIGRSVFEVEGPCQVLDEDAVERFLVRFVTVEEVDEGLLAAAELDASSQRGPNAAVIDFLPSTGIAKVAYQLGAGGRRWQTC